MNWHDCTPAEQDALIDAYILANRALTISYLDATPRPEIDHTDPHMD